MTREPVRNTVEKPARDGSLSRRLKGLDERRIVAFAASRRPGSAVWAGARNRLNLLASSKDDREFLPSHLEILETPASPFVFGFTLTLCLMLAAALLWSVFAHLDIYATAAGRVEPTGRSKIVQPFEVSKVAAIYVHNGDAVQKGEAIADLDASDAMAELRSHQSRLHANLAEAARRRTTITALENDRRDLQPAFSEGIPNSVRERETAAMAAELRQYDAGREALEAQIAEKNSTKERYDASIAAKTRLKSVLDERAQMRQTLASHQAGTRASVIDALQQVDQTDADIVMDRGQLHEAETAAISLRKKIDESTSDMVSKEAQAIAEALKQSDAAFQDVVKAQTRYNRTKLRAPIAGTVQQLAVTTVGQVVTPGQALAVIVPSEGPVDIEAMVLNRDIGFVRPGQTATIKIDSYPFTRYGTIEGRVVAVSRDAVDQATANKGADAIAMAQGGGISRDLSTPSTQDLVFPTIVEIVSNGIVVDGKPVTLSPGMTTTVEIHTGRRSVFDYLMSPIRETAATAGHER